MDDSGGPLGWEVPTADAYLVILLVPVENWQSVRSSPSQTLPAVDPEFATCYSAEFPALVAFLVKCGASYHDAADAAQEAFLELFKQWGDVRKPRQWLRTVAFRIFLRRPVRETSPLEAAPDASSPLTTSARFDLREEEKIVLYALSHLPHTQRAVLALHFDQFKTSEIAEILGMTQATVRKNLERARAALKKLFFLSGEQLRLKREPPAEETGGESV